MEPEVIINTVANYYHLPVDDVISRSRKIELIRAKHQAIYLIKDNTRLSLTRIGENFKGKTGALDHATILHAVKSVNNQCDTDARYRDQFNEVKEQLESKKPKKHKRGQFTLIITKTFCFYYFTRGYKYRKAV